MAARNRGHETVVVCHAGAGTVLASLATDQFDTAAQVAAAGAGVVAEPGPPSPDGIRAAFGRLRADPSYRDAAGALAEALAEMPPPEDVLERLLEFRRRW